MYIEEKWYDERFLKMIGVDETTIRGFMKLGWEEIPMINNIYGVLKGTYTRKDLITSDQFDENLWPELIAVINKYIPKRFNINCIEKIRSQMVLYRDWVATIPHFEKPIDLFLPYHIHWSGYGGQGILRLEVYLKDPKIIKYGHFIWDGLYITIDDRQMPAQCGRDTWENLFKKSSKKCDGIATIIALLINCDHLDYTTDDEVFKFISNEFSHKGEKNCLRHEGTKKVQEWQKFKIILESIRKWLEIYNVKQLIGKSLSFQFNDNEMKVRAELK